MSEVCAAHPSRTLSVGRAPFAAPGPGAPANAAQREILEKRTARWNQFKDILGPPGMDWSKRPRGLRGVQPSVSRLANARRETNGTGPIPLRLAILRVEFRTDRGGSASTGDGRFDRSGPDTTRVPIDRPPRNRRYFEAHGEALERYYNAQGYGGIDLQVDVWPRGQDEAYTVSDMADFGPWTFGQGIYRSAVHMFRTFILAADSQSVAMNDRIPWDTYDEVCIIHAGSDLQSDLANDSDEDIPSFTIGTVDTDRVILRDIPAPGDSVIIDRTSFVPETIHQDGYYGAINGVLAHECGHLLFGFVDLYDVETGIPKVGFYSLMDSGNLTGAPVLLSNGETIYATGLLPPSVDPFQRSFIGDALSAIEAPTYGDTLAYRSSERHPDIRFVPLSTDEYLLLENRYMAPASEVKLDQDDSTRVILGPETPDRFEYDALLPTDDTYRGGGLLIWHIDQSVIPFERSLRTNPDFGFNTNPFRPGISVIEADALQDLGDLGSPFLEGSYRDPWYVGNNAVLGDTTRPPLVAHTGSIPHVRIDVLSGRDSTMNVAVFRTWMRPGFPVAASYPPGGPRLLAIDADGDRNLEVCWAGGDSAAGDSTVLYAMRIDGSGLFGPDLAFAAVDRTPYPDMAAIATGGGVTGDEGPSLFAITTTGTDPSTPGGGGQVWLIDHTGVPQPGWPVSLPAAATTPPMILGVYPGANVLVGAADGRLYALRFDGTVRAISTRAFPGPVRGRLAGATHGGEWVIAAGDDRGDVDVVAIEPPGGLDAFHDVSTRWPQRLWSGNGFLPDFLWLDFDGNTALGPSSNPSGCDPGTPELVVHHLDRLWAFCLAGTALPGWGRAQGDTLVAGLGAGDPDGDGFPEVLTQSFGSGVAFVNVTGMPSPGWPRRGTTEGRLHEDSLLTWPRPPEDFPTRSPALALDVAGERRPRVVTLNASGLLTAFDNSGAMPGGWPLATGAGAAGAPLAADLDRDGVLEIVAPDRIRRLYAYEVPGASADPRYSPWMMAGGDPGRSYALPADRTGAAIAAGGGPFVPGSLRTYPNPARRRPVTFAWRMSEPGDAEFRILDTSGHEVAAFTRPGVQSDNLTVWDPGALPAGLYMARVRFRGSSGDHVEVVQLGLLR